MPMKATGPATGYREIDRFDGGVGWIAHPEEGMQRASHALRVPARDDADSEAGDRETEGIAGDANSDAASPDRDTAAADVWVVDPVDAESVDDLLAELGDVRGVVVLMDRHARDAAAFARRHEVPLYVPSFVDLDIDSRTEPVSGTLPGTDYEVVRTVGWPGWREAALYDGETLVVGDALGTAEYFTADDERVGVHPLLRVKPPDALADFRPERILVGHGEGVLDGGAAALRDALDGARRRAPGVWLRGLKSVVS